MIKILAIVFTFLNLSAFDAFVSPSELKSSLNNKNLVLIDVGSKSLYKQSHIKNAIHLDILNLVDKKNLYRIMNSSEDAQEEISSLGINTNSEVVIYSHNTNKCFLNSSYLALVLIVNGFENVSILDGGYMAWVFENELLTSTQKGVVNEDANYTISFNPNILVDSKYIQESLGEVTILDSRLASEYFGTSRSKNIERTGHIQSASSSYFKDKFLYDLTLRNDAELREIFIDGHKITKNDEVIVYGTNIFEASMNWFILYKHMEVKNTKIYEASLAEWGNNPKLPMTKFKWE